ncbi:MAG TPA: hypothetical protein VGL24_13100 [Chthoniobacterales bacterium]|jgi:hypothetical protein
MNLNLDEIHTLRARLREEIMERECLLAALDVVEKYTGQGYGPNSMQFGRLVSALLPSRPAVETKELLTSAAPVTASLPPPVPAALPPKPPVERYIHPELKHWRFSGHGAIANLVRWAIQRMTEDFSLHHIASMLEREGHPLHSPDISVVLTRLKGRGEIEEVKPAAGPYPAVFAKPVAEEAESTGQSSVAEAEQLTAAQP